MALAAALLIGAPAARVAATNEATLAVVPEAAIEGGEGLRITVDGRLGAGQRAFLVDETPAGESTYRAVFWFDANGLTLAAGDSLLLFEGLVGNTSSVGLPRIPGFRLYLRKPPRGMALRLAAELIAEDRTRTFTPGVGVPLRGRRRIQVEWQAASAPGAQDGLLRLSLLGARAHTATAPAVANAAHRLVTVRLGADEVDAGTFGSFFLDGFEPYRALAP